MPNDYLDTTDDGLRNFANNMVSLITPAPTSWGLSAPIAAELASLTTTYNNALTAAQEPTTRGGSTIFAKNQAKENLTSYIRTQVKTVQATQSVTDQMRYDLWITVPDNEATPINPPTEKPLFDIVWVDGRIVSVKLRSTDTERRGKPEGVVGASICMYVGALPLPIEITEWTTIGESTRTKFEVELPASVAPGTQVYLVAFWKNPRLQSGPPSDAVSLYIGGGAQQAA